MALKKWTTGDTITERSANNKGVRKGLTSDLDGIGGADKELGDHFYNETEDVGQQLSNISPEIRSNSLALLGADSNEVTVTGTTPTERKVMDVIIDKISFAGNQIKVLVRMKTDNAGTTANVRVRWDDDAVGPPAELVLSTTSLTFVIVKGSLPVPSEADGRHTINFYMDDGSSDVVTMDMTEVWGN